MTPSVFEELATRIDRAWKQANYADEAFTEISVRALEESELHRSFTPASLLKAALDTSASEDRVAEHAASGVIGLFKTPRFTILGHFWNDELGTIHHHPWSGAFQVI